MIRFLAFLLLSAPVLAAPPPGTDMDSPVSHWFQLLKQPETGYLCCSISDCRPVAYRTVGPIRSQSGSIIPCGFVCFAGSSVFLLHPRGQVVF
jgi:hypothetical protein